jgi:hypothetical protein
VGQSWEKCYNPATDRYEGDCIAVPQPVFEDAVLELVEGVMADREAWALLLDEREWSDDIGGVERLDIRLRLHCRRQLPPPQQRYCDAVCEAGFYAAAHS